MAVLAAASFLTAAGGARADAVVTPGNMGNWAFSSTDSSFIAGSSNPTAVGQMVVGPATPPLGIGSAELATGNGTSGGDGASILSNTGYAGVALSTLTALTYSTYVTSNNGQQFPYIELQIATGLAGPNAFDQLFFEPPYQQKSTGNASLPDQGASVLDQWQAWNALTGGWWDNDGLCGSPGTGVSSLGACITAMNNPLLVNFDPSNSPYKNGVGSISMTVGEAGAGDVFVGYVDDFTVGINGSNTTYDFDVPEPASLTLLGVAVAGLAGWRRRRQNSVVERR